MSTKYPGGIISKTAPTPSGPYSTDTAPGVWTLEQQAYWQKLGQWPTAGNVNPSFFIENLFSTYLYTGTAAAQTITNGIDLSTNSGLVWIKDRTTAYDNGLFDTVRGAGYRVISNSTAAENFSLNYISSFNSNGFSLGAPSVSTNASGDNYVSWTFREQAKFFDVVTFTTDGSGGAVFSHNLGSTPGCIIFKSTSASQWPVYHRSLGSNQDIYLNLTNAAGTQTGWCTPTSTQVTVIPSVFNASETYVGYLFAHDAGGFGLSGTENVISCGTYNGSGAAGNPITLGYEPQWILTKRTTATSNWYLQDIMRGMPYGSDMVVTSPNTSDADSSIGSPMILPTATGFRFASGSPGWNGSGDTYIYIAIRRGPMATPTVGTSVFTPVARTGTNTTATVTGVGFPVDFGIFNIRSNAGYYNGVLDRLRGVTQQLVSSQTNAEVTRTGNIGVSSFASNDGLSLIADDYGFSNENAKTYIEWLFGRAPGFMDVVCYTGTGSATTFSHNLGVVPEMMIVKVRGSTGINWSCYHSALGNTQVISLNEDIQAYTSTQWNNTTPTSTVFSVGTQDNVNGSAKTYVAYLFATCPGVSKVGSYTGTGTTLQINCGFTSGSRFVLIKRTDEVASGNPWYVWDSARGIVAGNDPYLLLNSTDAEVTGTDYVDTYSAGFEISSTAPSAINANGGTFIFLAIA
jgi:hypothetical protein